MLNPSISWQTVRRQLRTPPFYVAIIDNFLCNETLTAYRELLNRSKDWKTLNWGDEWQELANSYKHLINPDLPGRRILVENLQRQLQCESLSLIGCFAVACSANRGFLPHADNASIVVNLWLTSDQYNQSIGEGGMQFWSVLRPRDMPYELFTDADYSLKYIRTQQPHKKLKVPHKENRAVIFDGRVFHQSQRIQFLNSTQESMRTSLTFAFDHPGAPAARRLNNHETLD